MANWPHATKIRPACCFNRGFSSYNVLPLLSLTHVVTIWWNTHYPIKISVLKEIDLYLEPQISTKLSWSNRLSGIDIMCFLFMTIETFFPGDFLPHRSHSNSFLQYKWICMCRCEFRLAVNPCWQMRHWNRCASWNKAKLRSGYLHKRQVLNSLRPSEWCSCPPGWGRPTWDFVAFTSDNPLTFRVSADLSTELRCSWGTKTSPR